MWRELAALGLLTIGIVLLLDNLFFGKIYLDYGAYSFLDPYLSHGVWGLLAIFLGLMALIEGENGE